MKCNNILTVFPPLEDQESKFQLEIFKETARAEGNDAKGNPFSLPIKFDSFLRVPRSLYISTALGISFDVYYGDWEAVANIDWIKKEFYGIKPLTREMLIDIVEEHFPKFSRQEADIRKKNLDLYGATDWFDWSLKNWGTSQDVDNPQLISEDESLIYTFETNWNPPIVLIQKLTTIFPLLQFELDYECGGSRGRVVANKDIFEHNAWEGEVE